MKAFFKFHLLAIVVSIALGSCSDDTDMSQTFDIPPLDSSRKTKVNVNYPPTVSASGDMEILLPTEPLKLVGDFQDRESQKGTYLWRQVSGPSTSKINDSTTLSIQVTNLKTGNYIFEFKAVDSGGLSNSAFVNVNIIDVSTFQHQVLFDKVHWSCPWGCTTTINNFFEQLPQYVKGDPIMVFISYNSVWHLIKLTVWDDLSSYYIDDKGDLGLYSDIDIDDDTDVKVFY